MRDARRGAALCLFLLALVAPRPGRAASPDGSAPAPAGAGERTKLVLRIDGELGQERESALAGLLGSELAASPATLHLERSSEPRLAWTAARRRDPAALVIAILDVRDERAWALYVVDAARGRAIVRRLPGGTRANAAALEEVSAILTSAVAAVREGLEVASKPVEAVVPDEPGEAPPAMREDTPPSTADAQPPAPTTDERRKRPAGARPYAAALARASTLAGRFAPGAALDAGFAVGDHVRVLVHGAMDRPVRLTTPLGAFDVGRSLAALQAGYAWPLGALSLEPRLGSGVELIRRSGTAASPGVVGEPGETHPRFVAVFGVRARYTVAGPLALELGTGATLSPHRIRFTSGQTVLASAAPLSGAALAGVSLGLP